MLTGELVMSQAILKSVNNQRRSFIGGSDARIIMGNDEAALVRLWHEKDRHRGAVGARTAATHQAKIEVA